MDSPSEPREEQPPFEPRILPASDLPTDFREWRLVLLPCGTSFLLNRPVLVAGRHSQCDIVLPLPDISRRHCRFVFQDGQWWIYDGHSLNGIFVNDERVASRALKIGDRIRIGGFTLQVADADAAHDEPVLRSIAPPLTDVA